MLLKHIMLWSFQDHWVYGQTCQWGRNWGISFTISFRIPILMLARNTHSRQLIGKDISELGHL